MNPKVLIEYKVEWSVGVPHLQRRSSWDPNKP